MHACIIMEVYVGAISCPTLPFLVDVPHPPSLYQLQHTSAHTPTSPTTKRHGGASADPIKFADRDLKVEFKKLVKQRMALMVANEGRRADGRGPNEVRPISIELGVLPMPHGSVLFTRGETQVCVRDLEGYMD